MFIDFGHTRCPVCGTNGQAKEDLLSCPRCSTSFSDFGVIVSPATEKEFELN